VWLTTLVVVFRFYKELVVHPIEIAVTFKNSSTSEFLAAVPLALDDFSLQLSSCQLEKQLLKSTELSEQLTNIYTKKVSCMVCSKEASCLGGGEVGLCGPNANFCYSHGRRPRTRRAIR
jgi:hypothetical protein